MADNEIGRCGADALAGCVDKINTLGIYRCKLRGDDLEKLFEAIRIRKEPVSFFACLRFMRGANIDCFKNCSISYTF